MAVRSYAVLKAERRELQERGTRKLSQILLRRTCCYMLNLSPSWSPTIMRAVIENKQMRNKPTRTKRIRGNSHQEMSGKKKVG